MAFCICHRQSSHCSSGTSFHFGCRRGLPGGSSFSSGSKLLSGTAMDAASIRFMCSESLQLVLIHRVQTPGSPRAVPSHRLNSRAYTSYRSDRQAGSMAKPAFFSAARNYSPHCAARTSVARPALRDTTSVQESSRISMEGLGPDVGSPVGPRRLACQRQAASTMIGQMPAETRRFIPNRARDLKSDLSNSVPGSTPCMPCPAGIDA